MKKILLIILSLIILATPIFMLIGCGGSGVIFNEKMLENVSVNLSNVKSFGIANKKPDSTEQSNQAEKKNYLVTFDESNNIKDVIFYKENNKEMRQEEIPGQIEKIYVTKDFTYLMFVNSNFSSSYNRNNNPNYDRIDYVCDDTAQSFVIHNSTGRVYSLSGVCDYILGINDNVIYKNPDDQSNIRYFVLSVNNNSLILTSLINNPNIHVSWINVDRYGTLFAMAAQMK